MKKYKAEDLLVMMIKLLLFYIDELFECKNNEGERFEYGERLAYTECLELLQLWEKAEEYGLNFNLEGKYPL